MLTVLLTILIAVNTAQSSESSTAELLEKGIYTEETVGDLRLAIEIYAQVVEQVSGCIGWGCAIRKSGTRSRPSPRSKS